MLSNLTQGHLGEVSSTIKTPPVGRSLALKKAMMAAGAQNDMLLRFPPSGSPVSPASALRHCVKHTLLAEKSATSSQRM